MRHPEGHSHGLAAPSPGPEVGRLTETWTECASYLLGVDLFNRAYFWEAHEAWEEVWNAVGHTTSPGRLLQGMIQVSAALLKRHLGVPRGASGNFRKAGVNLEAVELECGPVLLGLDIPEWRSRVALYMDDRDAEFPYLLLEER